MHPTAKTDFDMFIANDLTELIGKTPLLRLERLFPNCSANILAKLEAMNPTSIKDRPALFMIKNAIDAGDIKPGTEVVEATSGNTGIGIACLSAILGFKARFYMIDTSSIERQKLLAAYGATVVLTPAAKLTTGARELALAYCANNPDTTFFANQHGNPNNSAAHFETTGPELWEQTGGEIGAVVIGMGTSGTIEGISKYLKANNSKDASAKSYEKPLSSLSLISLSIKLLILAKHKITDMCVVQNQRLSLSTKTTIIVQYTNKDIL